MRLFVAIELPADLKNALKSIQEPADGIRWQPAEQLHITLKFLGETSKEKAESLRQELQKIKSEPFSVIVKGIGKFPKKGNPKVIWAGVSKSSRLLQLQEKIEKTCLGLGFRPSSHAFTPHITIGRVRNDGETEAYRVLQKTFSYPEKVAVKHFTLFESRLSSHGARHLPLDRYKLERWNI